MYLALKVCTVVIEMREAVYTQNDILIKRLEKEYFIVCLKSIHDLLKLSFPFAFECRCYNYPGL